MIDITVNKKDMTVTVHKGHSKIKHESITPEEYKSLMVELSGDDIEAVRLANKLFKAKSFKFKGIK